MTENALVLRDTFDFDVAESMRAVNSLMDQFGLDSEQAFNLIVQGAHQGLNANGDMLDVINEYSVQFKTAGYSATDMFNMLVDGAGEGTWSIDKLGDAVKEFNIRAKDGTVGETIKENAKALGLSKTEAEKLAKQIGEGNVEAYEKFQDKLKGIDDDTTRYQIGVQAYGTMWEDLGENTILALKNTGDYFNESYSSMEKLKQVRYDDVVSQLQEMGRSIQTDILLPIAEDLLPVLKDGLSWLKDNLNWLLPTITGIGIAIGTYFVVSKFLSFIGVLKSLFTLVKSGTGIMTALNTVMALNPIALIVAAIVGLIAVFVLLWNKCDGFREFWINLWEGIKNAFSTVVNWFKDNWKTLILFLMNPIAGLFKYFYDNFEGFRNFVDNFVSSIKEFFVNLWEGIKQGASNFANWINTNVVQPIINFFQSLWNGVKAVWDGIVLGIRIAIGLIASIFDAALQIILLPFTFIWENCKQYVFQAWEWIKNAINTAINFISGIITSVFTAISTFFTTIWEGIKNTFTNVWNAIINFITPIINNIKTFITNAFNTIKGTISNILNAIKEIVTTIWNTITEVISNVINKIKETITNVFNAIKTFASNVWEGIKNVIINPIKNAWSNVKTTANNIKNGIVDTFNSLKSKVTSIFNKVK